ncbi:unnamed protein product [Eruca vesicaria subsp. sativa]|uniref:non-specific serine/threonine protein kinase n=1 Tax=Eruca vesicaria subsp. sativa TaxID=29727 RepID=A0ABC8LAX3_ERUVS|nr:unnamed protein product [Eruca vesicaria subsp. sativa]
MDALYDPVLCFLSADKLYIRCSSPFSCGDQSDLLYPFWISGREDCGHPGFELDCSGGFAELNISSVKFRVLDVTNNSRIIRIARSDFMSNICPQILVNAPFNQSVFSLAPNTEILTVYYDCPATPQFVSAYVGEFVCEDDIRGYYVTRNLSSPLLAGISGLLNNFEVTCRKKVSIPASGPALITLQNNRTQDNLKKALQGGFELGINSDCHKCIKSGGACGYNQITKAFICYCLDGRHNRYCGYRNKGIGIASILVGLVIAGGLICFISWRKKTLDGRRQQYLEALIPLKRYSYAQLKKITNSFVEVVGKGGFGTVYKGTLCDGRSVAVKLLKDSKANGEDFMNEVASMSKTSHVNIVNLLGFCYEGSKRAVLYEFLENGSLDRFISQKTSITLDWTKLYNIALGTARGIEYLHHGCKARIVHFDIKPQNVLLDDNFCPKVSDFGLAKLCENKESFSSVLDARGTIGYIAPEFLSRMYGRVSHKSDVYSYGMLVLEMIGARKKERFDQDSSSNTSSMYFPEWIYKDLEKGISGKLVENGISIEEEEIVKKMTLVGLWCIQTSPSNRPPMNKVVEMMEGNLEALEVPPRPVLQIPSLPLQESSSLSMDITVYAEERCTNVE